MAVGLQPDDESPDLVRELLPAILELSRYVEQRGSAVPRVPGCRRAELETLELERPGAIDAREEPGQPVRDRLYGLARVLLHADHARQIRRRAGWRSGRLLTQYRGFRHEKQKRNHDADAQSRPAGAHESYDRR